MKDFARVGFATFQLRYATVRQGLPAFEKMPPELRELFEIYGLAVDQRDYLQASETTQLDIVREYRQLCGDLERDLIKALEGL